MKIGVALSGGAVRGAAHIGALRALEELGIRADLLSGASAGAIAAGLYAAGMTPGEMERFAKSLDASLLDVDYWGIAASLVQRLRRHPPTVTGILKGEKLRRLLDRVLQRKMLGDVSVPLALSSVDLISGRTVYFVSDDAGLIPNANETYSSHVRLADAIRASCAIPMVFSAAEISGMQLLDGGLLENLPVEVLYAMGADRVIAVDLSRSGCQCRVMGVPEVGVESLQILSRRIQSQRTARASVTIRPDTGNTQSFDFAAIPELIDAGYEAVMQNKASILYALCAARAH